MFLNWYCHKKAIETFRKDTIKDDKLTDDEKIYRIINAKKLIKKEVKRMKKDSR